MITLYDYFRSTASYRVRIALNLKGLAYDIKPVHLVKDGGEQFSKAYQQLNPQSLVPTLLDNQQVITQSLAILEYLEETYPNPPLLPTDTITRAKVRGFAQVIACDIHPLDNLRVLKYLVGEFNLTEDQKMQWYRHWLTEGLQALELLLSRRDNETLYCFTKMPSMADICLVAQLYNARRFECPLDDYPHLLGVDERCQQLEAFKKAYPADN